MIVIETLVNYPGSIFNGEYQDKYNVTLNGTIVRTKDGLVLRMAGGSIRLDWDLFEDVGNAKDVKVRISLV